MTRQVQAWAITYCCQRWESPRDDGDDASPNLAMWQEQRAGKWNYGTCSHLVPVSLTGVDLGSRSLWDVQQQQGHQGQQGRSGDGRHVGSPVETEPGLITLGQLKSGQTPAPLGQPAEHRSTSPAQDPMSPPQPHRRNGAPSLRSVVVVTGIVATTPGSHGVPHPRGMATGPAGSSLGSARGRHRLPAPRGTEALAGPPTLGRL